MNVIILGVVFFALMLVGMRLIAIGNKGFGSLISSVSLFGVLAVLSWYFADEYRYVFVNKPMELLSRYITNYTMNANTSTIGIETVKETVAFYVSYECSAIIEFMILVSALVFMPFNTLSEKIYKIPVAMILLIGYNIIRLFIIIKMVQIFGATTIVLGIFDMLFFSHFIVSRVVFYLLILLTTYFLFTKKHVAIQKIAGDH